MGQPITTTQSGICFAFPDVCLTPAPPSPPVPIPYPNTGQLTQTASASPDVKAGGFAVVTTGSNIPVTTGDEAGSVGGVTSGTIKGKVEFPKGSSSVFVNGKEVIRMLDQTKQNNGNATGTVLWGLPTVLVGG